MTNQDYQEEVQAFSAWLKKHTNKSENTIYNYKMSLDRIYRETGNIDKKSADRFRDTMHGKYAAKTIFTSICAYNTYMKEFKKKPTQTVKNIKLGKPLFVDNIPTESEVNKLLSRLKEDGDMRGYFMVALLAQTGARISELIRFSIEDCERGYAEIIGKGKKQRTIFIPPKIAKEVMDYIKGKYKMDSGYLIPSRTNRNHHITTRGVAQRLQGMAEKYGIRKEVMHPHAFRHYFAKQFLKASKNDIVMLADLLGHSSIDTTAIYLRMSKKEAYKKFSKLVSWGE